MSRQAAEFDAFPFSAETARVLDQLCVEFESAWRRGGAPELAQFLARLPRATGTAGVECLLEIELAARRERGENPTWDRYAEPLCEWTEDAVGIWKRVSSIAPGAAEVLLRPIPLPDRFELLEELARGGMGTVFKVRHRHLDRLIAVKVLHRRLTDHPEAVERFRGEIRLLAALNHPGIAGALDADFVDGYGVLVLEFIDGRDLQRDIRERGPRPWKEALGIVRELASALQYAHEQGIVHRDVKPANVMLTRAGSIKLLDLGIADLVTSLDDLPGGRTEGEQAFCGTPEYAAPEQFIEGPVDARADVYGLGGTLCFLLTGRAPFSRDSVRATREAHRTEPFSGVRKERPDVPEAVERLLGEMLAKDPLQRPANMGDVVRRIDALIAAPRSRRRRRTALFTLPILALLMAGGVFSARHQQPPASRLHESVINSVGMRFVEIPDSGEDGASRAADSGVVGFREVTRRQYRQVMEDSVVLTNAADTEEEAVTGVTWHDAREFCRRLSERVEERVAGRRYRLPTESEWLRMARVMARPALENAPRQLETNANVPAAELQDQLPTGFLDAVWEWCDARGEPETERSTPDRLGEGIPARERQPITGAEGLFVHNFDLWDDYRQHLAALDGIRLRQESDGKTRYFEPASPRREGFVIYKYEFKSPIEEARLFAKILAHEPTSSAWVEVSADGKEWSLVDEGYISHSHESPRDLSARLARARQLWVRLRLREESEKTFLSQALRTSPNPDLQFPNVYQLFVVTQPLPTLPERRILAPATLKHSMLGFRVICEAIK